MDKEVIPPNRSTFLRRNNSQELIIEIENKRIKDTFLINGPNFITEGISVSDLIIKPKTYYMIINNGTKRITIKYNQDISKHNIVYNPYKFEFSREITFNRYFFEEKYDIPEGYIDVLAKWYSFKFIYPDYNLIFVRPEFGISIQIHYYRKEFWEILKGEPIVINGNKIYYFVKKGRKFQNPVKSFHSIINANKEENTFIMLKEKWSGDFDENDIKRVFNPNHYL